jgi:hypothetical protein
MTDIGNELVKRMITVKAKKQTELEMKEDINQAPLSSLLKAVNGHAKKSNQINSSPNRNYVYGLPLSIA